MQEFILTLVIVFVLFRIFSSNSSSSRGSFNFTQNNYNQKQDKREEVGKVSINKPDSNLSKNKDIGEYVDYEEVK